MIFLQSYQWGFSYRRKYVLQHSNISRSAHDSETDTFRENSTSLIDEIVAPLNEARIPFSSTQGVSRGEKPHRLRT
jgi:hypothetical protein